jgi:choline-glycine betaine transporter
MRASKGILKGLNPIVTIASKVLVIGFLLICAIMANKAGEYFEVTSGTLLQNAKWFLILLVSKFCSRVSSLSNDESLWLYTIG